MKLEDLFPKIIESHNQILWPLLAKSEHYSRALHGRARTPVTIETCYMNLAGTAWSRLSFTQVWPSIASEVLASEMGAEVIYFHISRLGSIMSGQDLLFSLTSPSVLCLLNSDTKDDPKSHVPRSPSLHHPER